MYLIVDECEQAAKAELGNLGAKYYEGSLYVGDFAIIHKKRVNDSHANEIIAVFERKTCRDLLDSIFYGGKKANVNINSRYTTQKRKNLQYFRAKNPDCRIFYIIEGQKSPDGSYAGFSEKENKIISGAICHMQVRDGIFIMETATVYETVHRLIGFMESTANLAKKHRGQIPGQITICEEHDEAQYKAIERKSEPNMLFKSKRRNARDQAIDLLASFKGISAKTSEQIIALYSPVDIFKACAERLDQATLPLNLPGLNKRTCTAISKIGHDDIFAAFLTVNGVTKRHIETIKGQIAKNNSSPIIWAIQPKSAEKGTLANLRDVLQYTDKA